MLLFFLIAVFSFLVQLFLPWWSMALAAFILSLIAGKKSLTAFFAGFLGCGIVWLVYALIIHFSQGDVMTERIGRLFSLPSNALLYVITFLVAALTGGVAAWAGISLKQLLRK